MQSGLKTVFVLIFCVTAVQAQYHPFDVQPASAESAGLAGNSLSIRDRNMNIYSNPALLAGTDKTSVSGGFYFSGKGRTASAVLPSQAGVYVPYSENLGFGFRMRPTFGNNFPYEKKVTLFSSQIFASYRMNSFYFFAGLGPSLAYRGREQSNYSGSFSAGVSYEWNRLLISFSAERPGLNFRFRAFRDSDRLQERFPDILSFALGYTVSDSIQISWETKRVLYENTVYKLNDSDSRPDFERGIGGKWKTGMGIQYELKEESVWKFRAGGEFGGIYDEKGRSRRSFGLGLGLTYEPSSAESTPSFSFSILDCSLFHVRGERPRETFYYFSAGVSWK